MSEAPKSSKASGKKSDPKEARAKTFGPVTAEMLAKLPSWAIAAWAGRCALRVQPLIRADSFGKIPTQQVASHIEALDIAVTLTMAPVPAVDRANYATKGGASAAFDAATDAAGGAAARAADAARAAFDATAYAADAAAAYGDGGGAEDAAREDAADAAARAADAGRAAFDAAAHAVADAAAGADYKHLVQSALDLETFIVGPLWLTGEPQGWRDIVSTWGQDLDSLSSQFPELHGIHTRHVHRLEGRGIDVEEARERLDDWFRRFNPPERSRGASEEEAADKGSLRSEEQDEQSEDPVAQSSETAAPDRRGAATSTLDAPTTDDSLDRKPLVQSLAAMFAAPEQATPFTLALLGDWGAGKSSVMDQLAEELKSGKYGNGALNFLFAKFNAWQYEHTDDIRAGLAQEVVKGLTNDVGPLRRFWLRIQFAFVEYRWEFLFALGSLVVLVLIAGSVFWTELWSGILAKFPSNSVWGEDLIKASVFSGAGIIGFYILKIYKPLFDHPIATKLHTYLKLPDYGKHLGVIPVMKRHIETICQLRGVREKRAKKRLIILIDDLDRCGRECILHTFDAVRLVMDIPNVIVVIAIDYRIAFAAVARHYADLADDDRSKEDIARDYLGKIIQLPVELAKPKSMRRFIRERLFATADKVETDRLAQVRELRSFEEEHDAIFEGAEAVDSKSSTVSPHTLGVPEDAFDSPSSSASMTTDTDAFVPRLMPETPRDCRFFEKWTSGFSFTNPRQLIRLRNSYRLLTQLGHAVDDEISDDQRMAMLFWLEFLHQKNEEVRKQYEDALIPPEDATVDGLTIPERDLIDKEIAGLGIRPQLADDLGSRLDEQRLNYSRLKRRISRFVLPAMSIRSTKPIDSQWEEVMIPVIPVQWDYESGKEAGQVRLVARFRRRAE